MKKQLLSRLIASGIHLSISGTLFLIITAIIYFYWYPNVHFTISGGIDGVILMLMIDIVLGPLITFLVFNYKKPFKEKRNDLLMVGLVQLCAMFYGIHNIYMTRPAAVIFMSNGMADTISNFDIKAYKTLDIHKQSLQTHNPPYYYTDRINTKADFSDALSKISEIKKGSDELIKWLTKSDKKVWQEKSAKYHNALLISMYGLNSKKVFVILDDKLNILDVYDK